MRVQRERSAERAGRKEVVLVTATTRVEAGANLKPRRMGWYLNDHATNLWGATFATTYDTTIVIVFTICLQGSIKKRHPSGRKRTRDLPDYARVVYREGMPSQQAISSAAAFKLGHGHPGLTHIAERREHNICPEWFLCRRGKAAPASIVNDACLQKVSMHTCMHALQARCSVMFPCCAHRADT